MAKSVFALPEEPPKNRLSVRDVAERYGVSEWTVYRWVRTKRLPCIHVSNRVIRFLLSDIEQYEKLHTSGRL
jgi:excisionase family DNA binding protein